MKTATRSKVVAAYGARHTTVVKVEAGEVTRSELERQIEDVVELWREAGWAYDSTKTQRSGVGATKLYAFLTFTRASTVPTIDESTFPAGYRI